MGNCGVGFAPCKPADHVRLIQLMEGVEDIPEPVLSAGIPWEWESFPGLHELAVEAAFRHGYRRATAACGAARLCDGRARRAARSLDGSKTTRRWRQLAGEAVRAGALGFSTSRTLNHRTSTGDFTPTLKAGEDELTAIAAAHAGARAAACCNSCSISPPSTKTCR